MIKKEDVASYREAKAKEIEPVEKKKEPTKDTEVDLTGPKGKFLPGPFVPGQRVVALKHVAFTKEDFVDDKGKELSEEKINKVKEIEKTIKDLIAKRELHGVVFRVEGDYVCVNLGKEFPFSHPIYPVDLIFPEKKTFLYFKQDSLGGIKSGDGGSDSAVAQFIAANSGQSLDAVCESVSPLKSDIETRERIIKDYNRMINSERERIISLRKQLEVKVESIREQLDGGEISGEPDQVTSIMRNPHVKDVSVINLNGEDVLCVTTHDLEYTDKKNHPVGRHPLAKSIKGLKFNIGGYKFILSPSGSVRATNYTKFIGSNQKHPCVNGSFGVCTGTAFGNALSMAIKKGDYASAVHFMIDFLMAPETNSPYIDAANFLLAQDLNIKAKSELDWFNPSFYRNAKFDTKKYKEELIRLNKEMFDVDTENNCVEARPDLPF